MAATSAAPSAAEAVAAKSESQARDVLASAVRFAFRAHQFAGGFNPECRVTFEEVKTRLAEVQARVAAREEDEHDDVDADAN